MKNSNNKINSEFTIFDSSLTKQHFSTKIFKVYLKCIQRHYPEISVQDICDRSGLSYEYIMDETNWASVVFDRNFTAECIETTGDSLLPYKSGLISLTPGGMGKLLFYLIKYTHSTTLIYRTITAQSLNFSKVMSMEIVREGQGFIHIKYHPFNMEILSDEEQKALLENLDNIYQNTVGYIATVPAIHNQPRAKVEHYRELDRNGIQELHMRVTYNEKKPIPWIIGLFLSAILLIAVFGNTWSYLPIEIVLSEFAVKCLIFGVISIVMVFGFFTRNFFRHRKIHEEAQKTIDKMDLQYRELQNAKETLRDKEALLRKMAENYPNSYVSIIEKDFTVGFTSGLEFKKQNINPDKFVGLPLEEVFPDYADITRRHYQETFKGEAGSFELSINNQYQLYHTVPLYSEDGSIPRILVVIENITERRQLESRIQQSQKMEAIGTLAGGIAHDFNNILYPIIGYTEMMLDSAPDGSDLHDSLSEVLTASLRASDLVKQILTFSRQEKSELKPIKMQVIIKEVMKLIRATIPSTIKIEHHIDTNCGMVFADPTSVHQIVMNLMTNAYHAMETEGGTLTIALSEADITANDLLVFDLNPGRFICFSVSDTGSGIDKHILDRIFEPYFTTKAEGKGTGLGLSVVHGIVKNYQGDIRVFSEPGKGTTFKVYLPVINTKRNTADSMDQSPVPGGNENVLLVDDEEPILKMETRLLERLGYKVTSRTSSLEALEAFRSSSNKFDLVVTDMTMPNMTGEKLALEIKKIRKGIPVIICTGFSEKMSRERSEALGIDGYLMKPIVRNELAHKIRTLLEKKKEK